MSNVINHANDVNLKIFPQLGSFPNEVGRSNSVGGIGDVWHQNLPLNYFYNFSKKKSRKRSRKSKKRSRSFKKKY